VNTRIWAAGAIFFVVALAGTTVAGLVLYRESHNKLAVERRNTSELQQRIDQLSSDLNQNQAAVVKLNEKIAQATPRAELIDEIFKVGLAAQQGRLDAQQTLGLVRKLGNLNDPVIEQRLNNLIRNPSGQAASVDLILYLTGSIVNALR
jgi:outer membrane murein-binding lipoprotein Lpp